MISGGEPVMVLVVKVMAVVMRSMPESAQAHQGLMVPSMPTSMLGGIVQAVTV